MKKNLLWVLIFSLLSCATKTPLRREPSSAIEAPAVEAIQGSGKIFLRSTDCATLAAAASALATWKGAPAAEASCACHESVCETDVTKLTPGFVLLNLGKTMLKANCFNTALLSAGLAKKIEFTKLYEFAGALRSSCAPVREPKPGDIGVVMLKNSGFEPVHAFVFLTVNFGFEKPGSNMSEPWRFMNPSKVAVGGSRSYPPDEYALAYFHCQAN